MRRRTYTRTERRVLALWIIAAYGGGFAAALSAGWRTAVAIVLVSFAISGNEALLRDQES